MAQPTATTHSDKPPARDEGLPLTEALRYWRTALRAAKRADNTVIAYMAAGNLLQAYLEGEGLPTGVRTITRRTLEAFLAHLAGRTTRRGTPTKAGTLAAHYRALQQLTRYLAEEGDIDTDPMAGMQAPTVPLPMVPVLTDTQIAHLLTATEGTDYDARRDAAIVRVMLDTGCRADEILRMTLDSADLDTGTVRVLGKGGKERQVAVGEATTTALGRYLRQRRTHRWAHTPALWLGTRGPLGYTGLQLLLARRARQAGIPHLHPHMLRHTWAHRMKEGGIQEDELMALGGWESTLMPRRYGRATTAARALTTGRRLSTVDALAGKRR